MNATDDFHRTVTQIRPPHGDAKPPFEPPFETVAASPEQAKVSAGLSKKTNTDVIAERYLLGDEIGHGGMGVVYYAKDVRLNRDVAVKLLLDRYPPDSLIAERFVEEARITAQLQHPGIAPVHDLGALPNGRPFLAMKLIKGKTLSKLLANRERRRPEDGGSSNPSDSSSPSSAHSAAGQKSGPAPQGKETHHSGTPYLLGEGAKGIKFLDIFAEICQTVAYAHNHGVIHRDLKPANVMVGAFGEVQVMDWGLAKILRTAESGMQNEEGKTEEKNEPRSLIESDRTPDSETLAGSVMGTPAYMPPEQAKGEVGRVDARSDVFALGAILCELLTGDPPYTGSFEEIRAHSILGDIEPARARLAACGADPDLIALATDCLAPDPARRPADAGEFVAWLTAFRTGVADRLKKSEQDRAAAEVRAFEQVKRRRVWLALAMLMVVGTATSLVFAIQSLSNAKTARDATAVAKDEARRVSEAHKELQAQKTRAETQLTRAEWLVYANSIDDAQRYLNEGRGDLAAEELNNCRIDYRGWEHDYLFSRLHEHAVSLYGHAGPVLCVAASRDGRRFVSGSGDRTVRIWDSAAGTCLATLTGHADAVTCVAISPDGRRVVSGSNDETVRVWDAETGTLLHEFPGGRGAVTCLAFSPDGRWLATGSWVPTVLVYDVATARPRYELRGHRSGVTSVAFSPDGRRIVTGSLDASLRLWDAETGAGLAEMKGHANAVTSVTFSPDGARVASGSRDRTVRLWDVRAEPAIVATIPHSNEVTSCVFGPDGTKVLTGSFDSTVRVWDAATYDLVRELKGHTGGITCSIYGPNGFRIVTGSKDQTLRVWDAESYDEAEPWPGYEHSTATTATSPDGKWTVARSGPRSLTVTDRSTGGTRAVLRGHADGVTSIDIRPDGTRVATATAGKELFVWETTMWTTVAVLNGHAEGVYSAVFSPDGTTIVSGVGDEDRRVWAAPLRQPDDVLDAKSGIVAVFYGADGTRVYARNGKGTTFAWVAATGQPVTDAETVPDFPGTTEAVSPDRRYRVRVEGDRVLLRDEAKWAAFEAEMKRRLSEWARPDPTWHLRRADECANDNNDFAERFHLRLVVQMIPTDGESAVRLAAVESRMAKSK